MLNILFPSAGRRVALLRGFRQAYQSLSLPGRIIATDIDPLAPALQVADRTYIVPRIRSPEYVPALAAICARESVRAVFPLLDPDVAVLASHRAAFDAVGARLAVVSPQAAAMTTDKWATTRFFSELGLRTPASWLPADLDRERAHYPLFIKPRSGSAAKDAYRVRDAKELDFFLARVADPIIQEFLPGPEITNDVICDLEGSLLAVVSRERIEVRNGEVTKGVTVYNPEIHAACVRIAAALPAVGPVTVQCMIKDGLPYFTEINARIGGGVPLAIAAGVNVPALLLARVAGRPVEPTAPGAYVQGLYLVRYDDSFFISESQREQMAGRHL